MGRGVFPVTPVYEDMHAQRYTRKQKKTLTSMRRPKSQKQPKSNVVGVVCDHQACSFVRGCEGEGRADMSGCPDVQ